MVGQVSAGRPQGPHLRSDGVKGVHPHPSLPPSRGKGFGYVRLVLIYAGYPLPLGSRLRGNDEWVCGIDEMGS